ncbi:MULTISPECIES: PKD domain-containing protein [unclassified Pseudoalteromonas]|uniref:PKD domain-containing protein n=1 Tax=unclassified Pseudoalteromonas TaxID=194690 RepID=UPI003014A2B4
MKNKFTLSCIALSLLLTGCGSDDSSVEVPINDNSGDKTTDIDKVPVIADIADVTVDEKATATIVADVEDDGEVTFTWEQISGPDLILEEANSDELVITAPATTDNEVAKLRLTVTDVSEQTATTDVTVNINQLFNQVTLVGKVIGVDLAGGTVTAQYGENENNSVAQIDEEGEYSVSLKQDDDESTSAVVSLYAQGSDDKSTIALQSYTSSFASLQSQAGDDNILSFDELTQLQLSPFSSATAALLEAHNGDTINNLEQLQQSSFSIDHEHRMNSAIVYQIYLDEQNFTDDPPPAASSFTSDVNAVSTPTAQTSLDWLKDPEEFGQYLNEKLGSPEYVEAKAKLLETEQLNVISSVPEVLYLPDYFYFPGGGGTKITFNSDGTGTASIGKHADSMKWVFEEGLITITPQEERLLKSSFTVFRTDKQGNKTEVTITEWLDTITISLTDLGHTALSAEIKMSKSREYSNRAGEVTSYTLTSQNAAYSSEHHQAVDITSGQTISLPLLSFNNLIENASFSSALFTFDNTNSGTLHLLNDETVSYNWQYLGQGVNKKVVIDVPTLDLNFEFQLLTPQASRYMVYGKAQQSNESRTIVGTAYNLEPEANWVKEEVVGVWSRLYAGRNFDSFWYELYDDGKSYSVRTYDSNNDGLLSEAEVNIDHGRWQLDNGELTLDSYQDPNCTYVGCQLESSRTFTILSKTPYKRTVLEEVSFADGWSAQKTFDLTTHTARPFSQYLPESLIGTVLPQFAPNHHVPNLVDVESLIDKELYTLEHDNWSNQEVSSLYLEQGGEFTYSGTQNITGDYEFKADHRVRLEVDESSWYFATLAKQDSTYLSGLDGNVSPYFTLKNSAESYAEAVKLKEPVASFKDLQEQAIFMADRSREGDWVITYLIINEETITVYDDADFSDVQATMNYTQNEDGSVIVSGNKLFIAQHNSQFSTVITVDGDGRDFNYFFYTAEQVNNFVEAANQLQALASH